MSIWTSKTRAAAAGLALVAALSGCQMSRITGPEEQSRFSGPPPSKMAVAGGQLIVSGPPGFCIDRDTSRDDRGGAALVMLSPCRGMGAGLFAKRAAHPAVLTVAVGARPMTVVPGQLAPALSAWFATREGRATLSRSGDPKSLVVHQMFSQGPAVYMRLTDPGQFDWGAVQPDYWRAVVPAGGRMVSLAVLAMRDQPLTEAEGLALLRAFVATILSGSALPLDAAGAQKG